jgi:hypothetical protein
MSDSSDQVELTEQEEQLIAETEKKLLNIDTRKLMEQIRERIRHPRPGPPEPLPFRKE